MDYPPCLNSWVQIAVPPHHVVIVSFLHMEFANPRDCHKYKWLDRLYLISSAKTVMLCGVRSTIPEVFDEGELLVQFKSGVLGGAPGFKLYYSLHQKTQLLTRDHDGLWNCSVPEWPRFELHFRCNLQAECIAWEDESQCFYAGRCGYGYLTLNGRCYKYFYHQHQSISWRNSMLECQRQGGYLASLNTQREWRALVAALRTRRSPISVFIGIFSAPSVLPLMYRSTHMWADKTIAYFRNVTDVKGSSCARFLLSKYFTLNNEVSCDKSNDETDFVCEWDEQPANLQQDNAEEFNVTRVRFSLPRNTSLAVPSFRCPAGYATHVFLVCDEQSACAGNRNQRHESETWAGGPSRAPCPLPLTSLNSLTSLPPMFECSSGFHRIPYTMVCDHREQCPDASDESFCEFPPCSKFTELHCASSAQCMPLSALCNGQEDCINGADETKCDFSSPVNVTTPPPPAVTTPPPPAVARFIPFSNKRQTQAGFVFTPLSRSDQLTPNSFHCPETHFQCPDNGYCLPVFVRCNGFNDCPGREDEAGCSDSSVSCPDFYRCRSSRVCLHPSHVCDGVYQCPQQDDELFCGLDCPAGCTCHGLAFTCHEPFIAESCTGLRYMDASGSSLKPARLAGNTLLIHLSLSRCGLASLHDLTFPNLRSLDLSQNDIHNVKVDHLLGMPNLQQLSLARNPLKTVFYRDEQEEGSLPFLKSLDASGVPILTLATHSLSSFPGLQALNLSHCGVDSVDGEGLQAVTSKLRLLDVVGCPVTDFPRDLLSGLDQLQSVRADNFKLCCPSTLPPGFYPANCMAPFDEVSSCESLLRSGAYKVFLSIFSSLALIGNVGSFLLRRLHLKSSKSGFGVFVTHLSFSDFLMGVYLAMIGVADYKYKGSYLWEDISWKSSTACKLAGFISMLSCEMSAILICLITLDRFLVLRFPFSSLHFKARSASITCGVIWFIVIAISAAPLTPMMQHVSFYGQTGICVPLPITRKGFAGLGYAFGVVIVFNFILFLLIAVGQAAIYASIRANAFSTANSTKKYTDLKIASRLISVALSDFLCWFPIGILGLLASRGMSIPGEVNVSMAILVLPLNSAINPFLYTINVMLQKRRQFHEEQQLKLLMSWLSEEDQKP